MPKKKTTRKYEIVPPGIGFKRVGQKVVSKVAKKIMVRGQSKPVKVNNPFNAIQETKPWRNIKLHIRKPGRGKTI